MAYTLISATPSPYARKVRVALAEKGIAFTLRTEVPWEGTTETPAYNPLEKLPVLVLADGTGVYESRFILEWLEARHPTPRLLPDAPDDVLAARQVEVIADGICDATVLLFLERSRAAPSPEWMGRQRRKVEGGLRALEARTGEGFLVGGRFGLADIAAGSALRYLDLRFAELDWRPRHPRLAALSDRLEQRESFRATVPVAQVIRDKVV